MFTENLEALFLVIQVNMLSVTSSKMQLQSGLNNFELQAKGCIQKDFHRPISKFTTSKRTSSAKSHLSYFLAVRSWWNILDISWFLLSNIPSRSKTLRLIFLLKIAKKFFVTNFPRSENFQSHLQFVVAFMMTLTMWT